MNEKCKFVLNNTNKCICKTANHGGWFFGLRGGQHSKDILFDEVNYISPHGCIKSWNHYIFFTSLDNGGQDNNCDKDGKYFINCDCDYCTYAKK
jgi:hypothetical protein